MHEKYWKEKQVSRRRFAQASHWNFGKLTTIERYLDNDIACQHERLSNIHKMSIHRCLICLI